MEKSHPKEPVSSLGKELTHRQLYSTSATGRKVKFNCQSTKMDFRGHKTQKVLKRDFFNNETRLPILTISVACHSGHIHFPNPKVSIDQKSILGNIKRQNMWKGVS
jgi:hypothetical protein